MNRQDEITVFYACDDRYIPYLSVSLLSLIENADKNKVYNILILNNGMLEENKTKILKMAAQNIKIQFVDVSKQLQLIADKLSLRDYYSLSIYFRIFIPTMFPNLDKAIYLDSDTVVLADIAELFSVELGDNLAAAVPDAVVASEDVFIRYADEGVGVPYRRYFNSGVMLMNLAEMRRCDLEGQFVYLLNTYHFNTICPDQDYLNVICKDRVEYLDSGWNKMSVDSSPCEKLNLIHFNMYFKPWLYSDVPYQEYFWKYAKKSSYYEEILLQKSNFGEDDKQKDVEAGWHLRETAKAICAEPNNFKNTLLVEEAVI